MRGKRQTERKDEIQREDEIQPERKSYHLEPLRRPGVSHMRSFRDSLNQVNLENDIPTRVKDAMVGIKDDPEIMSNLGELSKYIKKSSANDRVKKDLTIAIINEYPGIITQLEDSKSLSGFIKGLEIKSSLYLKDLVKTIITDSKDSKALIEITGLTNSKELSEFIKDLNIKDDPDSSRNKTDLIKTIIEKNPKIITDLKNLESLLEFIKVDLGIENKGHKRDLAVNIISKLYPEDYDAKEDLILKAINEKVIKKENFLKCGFDGIKEKDLHLKILEKAKEKKIVTDKDLFNYLEDKLPKCYESLKSVLNDKKVEDIIREEAIPNIANFIYGDNKTLEDINQLKEKKATSLIIFFDFFNKNEFIASCLIKDLEQKLKSSFQPINPKEIRSRDVKNIASLFSMNIEGFRNEYLNPKEAKDAGDAVASGGASSQSQLAPETSAPTLSSSIPVVSVSNAEPSNSPSPGGCFQAILKCLGR